MHRRFPRCNKIYSTKVRILCYDARDRDEEKGHSFVPKNSDCSSIDNRKRDTDYKTTMPNSVNIGKAEGDYAGCLRHAARQFPKQFAGIRGKTFILRFVGSEDWMAFLSRFIGAARQLTALLLGHPQHVPRLLTVEQRLWMCCVCVSVCVYEGGREGREGGCKV